MFYKRIKDLRTDSDLSQGRIAKIIGLHKTTYARYETGQREIPFSVAILLAKHYNVSLNYLAEITNDPKL